MNGVQMSGTWTFEIFDVGNIGQTSVLNSWGLQITAAKPVT
jgi:subtilisin-like proprotein convertase family protein